MRLRTIATLLATLTLLVGVVIGALIATPAIGYALALQDSEGPAPSRGSTTAPSAGPSAAAAPTSGPTPDAASPAAAYSGALIAPLGAREITREQLHEWVASRPFFGQDPENDRIWEQQQWLDIECMARKGFLDDPTDPRLGAREVSEEDGLTPEQVEAYFVAMWGPESDAPYDWRTAGCHGRSVHLTGQDDAH